MAMVVVVVVVTAVVVVACSITVVGGEVVSTSEVSGPSVDSLVVEHAASPRAATRKSPTRGVRLTLPRLGHHVLFVPFIDHLENPKTWAFTRLMSHSCNTRKFFSACWHGER
jgi:hypothetical protein